jgi:hypothetical protein
MWRNHSEGFPNAIIDNINILSEGDGDATLSPRRRFMRTSYVSKSATNVSPELNNSISISNVTRNVNDIIEGIVSHTTVEDNSSFTDDLSDSGPVTCSPSLTIIDETDEMVEEYPEHDTPGEFHIALSHNLLDVITEDIKQFFAI